MEDEANLTEALKELIETFNKHNLRIQDILLVYGNLGYALGASIEGYKGKGPDFDALQKKYYEKPTIGVALMLQGMTITSWHDDYIKTTQQGQQKNADKEDDKND